MAENPYAKYRQSGPMIPGTGPKPPAGYQSAGPGAVAPLLGGPQDPAAAARMAAAEAAARSQAGLPAQMAEIRARQQSDLQADAIKRQRDATMPQRPTAADIASAKDAIANLTALRNQIKRSAVEFDRTQFGAGGEQGGGGFLDRLREYVPGFMNAKNDTFDATVSGLAPLAKMAFRTPGEGAFSDRDQALFMAMMPSRAKTDAGNIQRYRQMGAMVDDKIRGKQAILGQSPNNSRRPKAKPAQPRVIDFNDLPE